MAAPKSRRADRKRETLRRQGVLNAQPERVRDPLFTQHEFFDPQDLVQVKYELVRRVEADGMAITDAVALFGFSRPSFYQARASVQARGLAGLLPKKRGPRSGHKLSADVVAFAEQQRLQDSAVRAAELARRIAERFGVAVHPRSVERALARQEKKRQ
jgi:transposase